MTPSHKTHPPQSKRLFAEPSHPEEMYTANVDGAARGNPGPAAYGVVIRKPDGTLQESLGKQLGVQTNNVAEYHALIAALDYAEAHSIRRLRVRSDSLLLVQQMKGVYKVKHPALKPLHERAARMSRALEAFAIEHVPRERNAEADALANAALDGGATEDVARLFRGGAVEPGTSGGTGLKTPASNPAESGRGSTRIRARFSGGALHPSEALPLAEGEEVEVTIRRKV